MTDTDRSIELLIEHGRDREAVAFALSPAARTTSPRAQESTMSMTETTTTVDFDAIKQRQQGTWSSGDYAVIGTTLQLTGESLCEALDVAAGERVLDVAAGNGNVALAAARRGCEVTATDYVPALLDGTRARAAAEGLTIDVREADAEALPFADESFDVVVSTFGVMFTPNQEQSAAELLRVCRPGGRIGLTNWTPEGFIGQMFKIVGRYAPPPAGIRSPLEWGKEARLAELFGADARVEVQRRAVRLPLPLGRALARRVPRLLRPDVQGLRSARRGRPGGVRDRAAGPRQQPQHVDHGHAARPERVPRGRRRQGPVAEAGTPSRRRPSPQSVGRAALRASMVASRSLSPSKPMRSTGVTSRITRRGESRKRANSASLSGPQRARRRWAMAG